MAETTDVGRFFFHRIFVRRGTPWLHMATTVEVSPPFRRSRSLVLRLPRHRALVMGWWRDTEWDEETALMTALSGWGIDPFEDDLEDPEVRRAIRKNIAASGVDLDDEWQIISALGVQE